MKIHPHQSIAFHIEHCHKKTHFLSPVMIFLKKWITSLLWKKICWYKYAIFLILLTKSISELANFLYLFPVTADCGLGCVEVKYYFCVDYIPSILLKHLDQSLMSILVWVYLSMTYRNETLNTSLRLSSQ